MKFSRQICFKNKLKGVILTFDEDDAMLSPHTPPQRGTYKQIPLSAKRRVLAAYEAGGDWAAVAAANGINKSSARNWFSRPNIEPLPRGGNKPRILTDELVDKMQEWVEFDNQITLQEIKDRLLLEKRIDVSTTTIHRELDKRVFTYKNVHYEPLQMNDMSFKEKRRDYVEHYRALSGEEKIPIWLDETNFNLFTARTKARSRRGTRAVPVRGAPQVGKSLHIIGAISATNFAYCTHKRGAFTCLLANEWLRQMLRVASAHYDGLENKLLLLLTTRLAIPDSKQYSKKKSSSATFLRLSPYSPMLNPIETLSSQVKAQIKSLLRERLAAFMGSPPDQGITREEFRMQYLEFVAQGVIDGIDVHRLHRYSLRLEYFYGMAERMENMQVGM
ncbi:hypothetical protein AeMF1_013306 [Aphanomyces euteiches]|nr:hypothetical protein AeMF1_013306 [Aphanomyces euteiches]KAH9188518.1 hypothetical protein AeNC1_009506 [Aphanomyces euteiches]